MPCQDFAVHQATRRRYSSPATLLRVRRPSPADVSSVGYAPGAIHWKKGFVLPACLRDGSRAGRNGGNVAVAYGRRRHRGEGAVRCSRLQGAVPFKPTGIRWCMDSDIRLLIDCQGRSLSSINFPFLHPFDFNCTNRSHPIIELLQISVSSRPIPENLRTSIRRSSGTDVTAPHHARHILVPVPLLPLRLLPFHRQRLPSPPGPCGPSGEP